MNSMLLCEGSTDFALLQYFMRQVYGWEDQGKGPRFLHPSRTLEKENRSLVIGGVGGSSRLIPVFRKVAEGNKLSSSDTEYYSKIAIMTDRDEIDTEKKFLQEILDICGQNDIKVTESIESGRWISGEMFNARKEKLPLEILILIIPFEKTGALETFLLDSISEKDTYDKEIIDKGNLFVENIDREKRYLNSRRYMTKAKFDVYFSVRTPAAFFVERQNILKGIQWDKYLDKQREFYELQKL